MPDPTVSRPARPRRAGVLTASVFLASCATGPLPERGPPIPLDPLTLLDDYVLAHGFAAGLVLTPGIDRQTILTVVQLDRAALQALGASASNPSDPVAAERAQDAIEALTAFAARS